LTKEFNIPEDHIFNSRDIQFENQILSATKGKGVDIVLNSLAEEKLQASFRCVAVNGRFIEIGKYDLQMNNKLGMFSFLKNISFISVTIENFFYSLPNKLKEFFDWIHENSRNGCVKPIKPIKIFEPTEAEQAFRHMSTGRHIGKLVIKMRDEEDIKTPLLNTNPTLKLTVNSKTFFNPNKVYIIIGGLGGFGLELAQWMTLRGGKKIVLTSRTGIRSNYQRVFLKRLEDIGKMSDIFKSEIIISTHDSNTEKGAKTLLEEANKLGSIGGIFHLALVLNDSLYENQTIEGFRITCESKINTFVNLDKLTRDLYPDIDYFVCFSSVACGRGNGGQSNYGYANSVIERICEKRRSDGLHGLAIQYGPIGDVGLMADNEISSFAAIVKQRILSCLDVFDKFLQSKHTIISSIVSKMFLNFSLNSIKIFFLFKPKFLPILKSLNIDSLLNFICKKLQILYILRQNT
jgi:fatty acid synthase